MEKTIDKQTLLKKTMWGVDIYAHILRKFFLTKLSSRL